MHTQWKRESNMRHEIGFRWASSGALWEALERGDGLDAKSQCMHAQMWKGNACKCWNVDVGIGAESAIKWQQTGVHDAAPTTTCVFSSNGHTFVMLSVRHAPSIAALLSRAAQQSIAAPTTSSLGKQSAASVNPIALGYVGREPNRTDEPQLG